ncbi:NTF2-like protein [Cadophora sp. DSE1049]|nr:NTF2-like protein [Cadophora sp. DSE1049]
MATNGSFAQQEQYKSTTEQYPATSGATDSTGGNASGNDLSKDEVGWYFVEQYYTTLSKSPEKLHLFYGKRSQFVSGLEAEVAPVSVGRIAIQERIKDLDFQDCKVRVSNVDSQASYDNIVIQVIGETSNKSAELKKFVQTFVLAQQPTGYFVLNDIFRYINEEGEEEPVDNAQEESAAGPLVEDVEMPKAQATTEEPAAPLDAEVIDKKLDEVTEPEPVAEAEPTTNGTPAPEVEETPAAAPKAEEVPTPEVAEKEGTMGYVRNVTEKVGTEELRAALGGFGNLIYFDVNRGKNCAFVEYATPEGYQAAAAANPHQVSGEAIYVEPRRPKPSAYGGNGYAGGRGGLNQRGRGQFQNRGRGGGGAPRGRGTSTPTNA